MPPVAVLAIWLLPIIPIALYETWLSRNAKKAAAASVLTWSVAVVSYYIYGFCKLIFVGSETLPDVHVSQMRQPNYWHNFWNEFTHGVVFASVEWLAVAVIGGGLIGGLLGLVYLKFSKPRAKD